MSYKTKKDNYAVMFAEMSEFSDVFYATTYKELYEYRDGFERKEG